MLTDINLVDTASTWKEISLFDKIWLQKSEKGKLGGNDQDKKIRRKQENLLQHIFTKIAYSVK